MYRTKSILLTLFCLSLTFTPAYSQWQVISNQKGNGEIYFVNDTLGFSLDKRSTDGGINWQSMPISSNAELTFTSENDGHLVENTNSTSSTTYWQTHDGGLNWVDKSSVFPNPYGATKISFPTASVGYAGNGKLYKTTDGGNSWSPVFTGRQFSLHSLHFISPDAGFMSGYLVQTSSNYFYSTTDGGTSWDSTLLPINQSSPSLSKIFALNQQTILAINFLNVNGEILRSTDGGQSWNQILLNSDYTFTDIYFPTPDTGYVVGMNDDSDFPRGLILKTVDAGLNWQVQPSNYNNPVFSCHFTDGYTGWAAGVNGDVLFTGNGGAPNISVDDKEVNAKWTVYPNPANNRLIIELPNNETTDQAYQVKLYNISSQLVEAPYTLQGNKIVLETVTVQPGFYWLKIITNQGKKVSHKIIIE